jgi:hypothetical protein
VALNTQFQGGWTANLAINAGFRVNVMNGINADLKISKPEDWQMFRQKLLDVIVDPMVFRSAEIFLRGQDKQFELGFESAAKAGWEKDGFKGICVDAGIKVPVPIGRIWGWILEKLPGHRYVKVLTRLKLVEHQYPKFERHLQKIWSNA